MIEHGDHVKHAVIKYI